MTGAEQCLDRRQLPVTQGHRDRLRRGRCAGFQQKTDQSRLQALVARRRTCHHQFERIIQIGPLNATRDHRLGHVAHIGWHRFDQGRIVGDEPEKLGVEEILGPTGVAVAIRLLDALAQKARFGVEQAREFDCVATMDRRHGCTERWIADHRAVEQFDDGGFIDGPAPPGNVERRPPLAITLPFDRAGADQTLHQLQRSACRRRVQGGLTRVVAPRAGPGGQQRFDDFHPICRGYIARAGLPERGSMVVRCTIDRITFRQKTADCREIAARARPRRGANAQARCRCPEPHRRGA